MTFFLLNIRFQDKKKDLENLLFIKDISNEDLPLEEAVKLLK